MHPEALALVVLSAFLHAAWSALMKRSPDLLAFNALQCVPSLVLGAALLPLLPVAGLGPGFWAVLAASSLIHGVYFLWLTRALELGDLSLVYPIVRSTPAVIPLLALPLLGERPSPAGAAGIAVVVAGVWLVQGEGRISRRALLSRAAVFAWLSLATTVGYSLTDKRAMTLLDAAPWPSPVPRSVAYFFLLSAGSALVFLPLAGRHLARARLRASLRRELGLVLLSVAASLASYGLILEAFRSAPVSYVVAVRQSSVLFAVLLSVLWLRERPSAPRLAGAVATVGGVALIAVAG